MFDKSNNHCNSRVQLLTRDIIIGYRKLKECAFGLDSKGRMFTPNFIKIRPEVLQLKQNFPSLQVNVGTVPHNRPSPFLSTALFVGIHTLFVPSHK